MTMLNSKINAVIESAILVYIKQSDFSMWLLVMHDILLKLWYTPSPPLHSC